MSHMQLGALLLEQGTVAGKSVLRSVLAGHLQRVWG